MKIVIRIDVTDGIKIPDSSESIVNLLDDINSGIVRGRVDSIYVDPAVNFND